MIRSWTVPCLCTAALSLVAAAPNYAIRGQLNPPQARATVVLSAVDGPFMVNTASDTRGRFRFKGVQAGEYTICVFAPGFGESLQTVELAPERMGTGRSTDLTIRLNSTETAGPESSDQYTVSVRGLAIPPAAQREVAEALKLLARKDIAAATRRFQRAVEIAPQYSAALNSLGTIAYHEGKFEVAEAYFRRAHENDPTAFDPGANLGGVLLNLGKYDDALPFNAAAAHERPQDALANSQMGLNYYLLGKLEDAIRYLKEAERIDPAHFTHPQKYLAEIYLRLSNRKAAAAELEDLAARNPGDPEAVQALELLSELRER